MQIIWDCGVENSKARHGKFKSVNYCVKSSYCPSSSGQNNNNGAGFALPTNTLILSWTSFPTPYINNLIPKLTRDAAEGLICILFSGTTTPWEDDPFQVGFPLHKENLIILNETV